MTPDGLTHQNLLFTSHLTFFLIFEGGLRISVAVSSLVEAKLGKDLVLRVEKRSPAIGLHSSSCLWQTVAQHRSWRGIRRLIRDK